MKLLVGFCGRARHGKDSVACIIRGQFEAQGYSCFQSTFSDIVLAEAKFRGYIPSGVRREDLDKAQLQTLVDLGHAGRGQYEDFWQDQMDTLTYKAGADVALRPGVRFPNEIKSIKDQGGVLVRVRRFNEDGSDFISPDRDPNDPMETVLNRIVADYEISAKTGQDGWLEAQAQGLANYFMRMMI